MNRKFTGVKAVVELSAVEQLNTILVFATVIGRRDM